LNHANVFSKKYRFLDRTSIFVHLLLKMNENYQKNIPKACIYQKIVVILQAEIKK